MATKFNMTRDINGYNGFGLQFTDIAYATSLSANAEQHFTVPELSYELYLAIFSFDPGTRVWVSNGDTAAVPAGSFAATTSELNPTARQVKAGDILSFISPDVSVALGVYFYGIS